MSTRKEQLPDKPAEIHFEIPHKGLKDLGLMLDGNGVKADQIRIARHETIVHQVPGVLTIALEPEISNKQLKGKQHVGETLGSKHQVMSDITALCTSLLAGEAIQKEIVEGISEKPGQSFGADPYTFRIKSAHKEYSVVDTCQKCDGSTMCRCGSCGGDGSSPCTMCNGNGFTQCAFCYGSGQQQKSDGSRPPCGKCGGVGRDQCRGCQGFKEQKCSICSGQGKIGCTECDRSGFWTHVFDAHFVAKASFALERAVIPPEVLEVVDILGVKQLATEGHAEVLKLIPEVAQDKLLIPFVALLPVAQVEFTLEGKAHPAVIAGLNGRIVEIEPLMDKLIKPGISALMKLSKGPMAVAALMATACRFKAIRQVLAGTAHHSKGYVYKKVVKEYPLVLSENYAKAAINYAYQAVLALSEGPRWKGLVVGTALSGILAAGYYLTGLRTQVANLMGDKDVLQHLILADMAVWVLGYMTAIFCIKLFAAAALKKILPDSVQVKDRGLPAAGKQGLVSLPASFLCWLTPAFFAAAKPEWFLTILAKLGMG